MKHLHLTFWIAINVFFFIPALGFTQGDKIKQIDSLVKEIKKRSDMSVKATYDTSWLIYPDGHRTFDVGLRKSYYDSVTGTFVKVLIDSIIYYYTSGNLIAVRTKLRHGLKIYYWEGLMIKSSNTQFPNDALEIANMHLKISKMLKERFLNELAKK